MKHCTVAICLVSQTMTLRTAKFFKALTEKAQAEKRIAEMLMYESATVTFEMREKQVLADLFNVMTRRAHEGYTNLPLYQEPTLKRIEIQSYLKKKGFRFANTYGCDAVFWNEELK